MVIKGGRLVTIKLHCQKYTLNQIITKILFSTQDDDTVEMEVESSDESSSDESDEGEEKDKEKKEKPAKADKDKKVRLLVLLEMQLFRMGFYSLKC